MSEKQAPVVAKLLNLSEDELKQANISRLVASCLITGKNLERELGAIYNWCLEFLDKAPKAT